MYQGKVIVITGATSGIGKYLLESFCDLGATVYGLYLNREEVAQKFRSQATMIRADVTDQEQVSKASAQIQEGRVDILINNAGISLDGKIDSYDLNNFDRMYKTNLYGKVNCIQKFLPLLRRSREGHIINIASRLASKPMLESTAYCSMAAAIVMMTKTVALELLPERIRVNCVSPSLTDTPLARGFYTSEQIAQTANQAIGDRLCQPQDVLRAIRYLCDSPDVFVTGENLNVSGGILLR